MKTLNDIAGPFLADKSMYVKPSTANKYAMDIYRHLLSDLGINSSVTEEEAQQYVNKEIRRGQGRSAVINRIAVLKMMLKWGQKRRLLPVTMLDWNIIYPRRRRSRPQVLSKKNQRKLLDHCRGDMTWRNFGILVAMSTGLRIGEVCGLKWKDFNLDDREITVGRTVQRQYDCRTGKTFLLIGRPKTDNSARTVPMSRELCRIVRGFRKSVRPDHYVLTNGPKPGEPRCYRDYYRRLLERLEIPYIGFHGLRHTFATRCLEGKCDVKVLSSILGHANITTTLNLYVHPDRESKSRAVENMFKTLK